MKLNYITPPENAGGTAVPGCGTIHKSEIHATLTRLSGELEFPFDLNDYIIASTGKREYSGDIDIVLDTAWYNSGAKAFRVDLAKQFGPENVARNADMVHLKYPIVGFDVSLQGYLPRTGFVQVDFNFGDPDWERFYHFSPGNESAYKGAHRNLAIAAICGAITEPSGEFDSFDRPVSLIRWKWNPKGFVKINRHSIQDSEGNWYRKQVDEVLMGPFFDGPTIASILFPIDGQKEDLDSLETIMNAVKRNYSIENQWRIWKRMASNLSDWKDGKNFIYPPEITRVYDLI